MAKLENIRAAAQAFASTHSLGASGVKTNGVKRTSYAPVDDRGTIHRAQVAHLDARRPPRGHTDRGVLARQGRVMKGQGL